MEITEDKPVELLLHQQSCTATFQQKIYVSNSDYF